MDVMVGNALIHMYSKCNSLEDGRKVFDGLLDRTVVSWNAMLSGYCQQGLHFLALEFFVEMQQESIRPTDVTFVCILKVCGTIRALDLGEFVHDKIIKEQPELDVIVGNTLVDMYANCGSMDAAFKAFCYLPSSNVVSWGALISGYTQHEDFLSALVSFERMQNEDVKPDLVILLSVLKACSGMRVLKWGRLLYDYVLRNAVEVDSGIGNTLVDMYARCGSLVEAERIFDRLSNQNVVSWNAMISGYSQHGNLKQVIEWFDNMRLLRMKPTSQTFTSILAACSQAGKVEEGYRYLHCMLNDYDIAPVIEHYNCMIDLLGRSGFLNDAERLLNTIPSLPNINGWMSLLTSCLLSGSVDLGKRCFEQVIILDPSTSAGHMLMLNIYADAQMWKEVYKLCEARKSAVVKKQPGKALLEVDGELHEFTVGDTIHLQREKIPSKVIAMFISLRNSGFIPLSELMFESTCSREDEDHEQVEGLLMGLESAGSDDD